MCKGVGHGSNYYGKPPTIAKHLRMDVGPVHSFQSQYFGRFPGIPKWHAAVARQLQTKGFLTTPFNRRRHFFGRRFEDETLREAIANVPQSFIGDYLNIGLRKVWENQTLRSAGLELLAQVHDAILIQYPTDQEQIIVPQVLDLMSFPVTIRDIDGQERELVIPTSAEVGWNWGHYELSDNPHGLIKFRRGEPDERTAPKETTLLDCRL